MTEFSSYAKMPTGLSKLGLSENDYSILSKIRWVVTEKVHGANFSFIYENRTLKFAKRKEYLDWKDDFFGFQIVVGKYETNIIKLFEKLSSQISADKYIIYGELFGGKYPHKNVPEDGDLKAIQTGVYYSPTIDFYAFDIAYVTINKKRYLSYRSAGSLFEAFNLLYAKTLFVGKLNEATGFDLRINSTIPKDLKLPLLQNNLIEGVVIKPYDLDDDSKLTKRPILKIKNPEFDDLKQFHEAKKWSYIPDVSSKSEDLSFILQEILELVNENRLQSAVSKIGSLEFDDPNRLNNIKNEILEDVCRDFNEHTNNLLNEISEEQSDWILERVRAKVNFLISEFRKIN